MEYKVMDFQKYTDYIGDRWDETIEMGKFEFVYGLKRI